ncbi:hypothetical protein ACFL0F_02535 [Patescibacteria group bacterium]
MTVESGERPVLPPEEKAIIAHQIKFVILTGSADDIEGAIDNLLETYDVEQLQDIIGGVAGLFEQTSRDLIHEATELAMDVGEIDDII